MDYNKLIEMRQSYRTFTDKKVEEDRLSELKSFFKGQRKLADEELSMEIFTDEAGKRLEGVVGYNGYAFEAPAYMVFKGRKSDTAYVAAGFSAMDMVLKAVDLGLDTCFLTVEEDAGDMVKKVLRIESDEDVLSVVALGYAEKTKKKKRIDIISPSNVKMIERKGSEAPKISVTDMVYANKWGQKSNSLCTDCSPAPLYESLNAASLAPYFFNLQNYRYILCEDRVIFANKDDEKVCKQDKLIGEGCTLFNFYAIYRGYNKDARMWTLGSLDLDFPEGYSVEAYMNI